MAAPRGTALPSDLPAWLALLEARHPKTIDLGLERCGAVWQAMGAPRIAGQVLTVAGTNGKGSAVAWSCALLGGLHLGTAAYTSPHLLRFNERLRLRGGLVGDAALCGAFQRVEAARGDTSLSYFEFTTLACLDLVARDAPDVAVLEVGLGGRLDAVNLVDPDCALIMPVGLDHQEYLGPDRERIGAEKAGILRAGRPLICGEPHPPASVLARAAQLDCPVSLPGRDHHHAREGGGYRFRMRGRELHLPLPRLDGPHQDGNLAAALAAVATLRPEALDRPAALAAGMQQVRITGRLMTSATDPRLVLDVGHNPLAAQALAGWLAARGRPRARAVLGMLADKDAGGVAQALAGYIGHWHCAGLPGARGQDATALAQRVRAALPGAATSTHADVAAALAAARAVATGDEVVLVFGSFHTVAAALEALGEAPAA